MDILFAVLPPCTYPLPCWAVLVVVSSEDILIAVLPACACGAGELSDIDQDEDKCCLRRVKVVMG